MLIDRVHVCSYYCLPATAPAPLVRVVRESRSCIVFNHTTDKQPGCYPTYFATPFRYLCDTIFCAIPYGVSVKYVLVSKPDVLCPPIVYRDYSGFVSPLCTMPLFNAELFNAEFPFTFRLHSL